MIGFFGFWFSGVFEFCSVPFEFVGVFDFRLSYSDVIWVCLISDLSSSELGGVSGCFLGAFAFDIRDLGWPGLLVSRWVRITGHRVFVRFSAGIGGFQASRPVR